MFYYHAYVIMLITSLETISGGVELGTASISLGPDEDEWVSLNIENFSAYVRQKIQEDMKKEKDVFHGPGIVPMNNRNQLFQAITFITIGISLILMSLPTFTVLSTSSFLMVSGVICLVFGVFSSYSYVTVFRDKKKYGSGKEVV